jgi:hypothetical protein
MFILLLKEQSSQVQKIQGKERKNFIILVRIKKEIFFISAFSSVYVEKQEEKKS